MTANTRTPAVLHLVPYRLSYLVVGQEGGRIVAPWCRVRGGGGQVRGKLASVLQQLLLLLLVLGIAAIAGGSCKHEGAPPTVAPVIWKNPTV